MRCGVGHQRAASKVSFLKHQSAGHVMFLHVLRVRANSSRAPSDAFAGMHDAFRYLSLDQHATKHNEKVNKEHTQYAHRHASW